MTNLLPPPSMFSRMGLQILYYSFRNDTASTGTFLEMGWPGSAQRYVLVVDVKLDITVLGRGVGWDKRR